MASTPVEESSLSVIYDVPSALLLVDLHEDTTRFFWRLKGSNLHPDLLAGIRSSSWKTSTAADLAQVVRSSGLSYALRVRSGAKDLHSTRVYTLGWALCLWFSFEATVKGLVIVRVRDVGPAGVAIVRWRYRRREARLVIVVKMYRDGLRSPYTFRTIVVWGGLTARVIRALNGRTGAGLA